MNQRGAFEELLSSLAGQRQLLLRLIEMDPMCPALASQLLTCDHRIVEVSAALFALSSLSLP